MLGEDRPVMIDVVSFFSQLFLLAFFVKPSIETIIYIIIILHLLKVVGKNEKIPKWWFKVMNLTVGSANNHQLSKTRAIQNGEDFLDVCR